MKKTILFVFIGLLLLLISCVSGGALMDKDGVYNIEAEKMTLVNAEITALDGESGGNGIKLLTPESSAFFEIKLPAGEYLVNAYINAPDGDHDAFYIIGDETQVQRVYPPKHAQMSYCAKFLTFMVENEGLHTLKIAVNWPGKNPGETGMIVDKLEVVPVAKSAPVLDKWLN